MSTTGVVWDIVGQMETRPTSWECKPAFIAERFPQLYICWLSLHLVYLYLYRWKQHFIITPILNLSRIWFRSYILHQAVCTLTASYTGWNPARLWAALRRVKLKPLWSHHGTNSNLGSHKEASHSTGCPSRSPTLSQPDPRHQQEQLRSVINPPPDVVRLSRN